MAGEERQETAHKRLITKTLILLVFLGGACHGPRREKLSLQDLRKLWSESPSLTFGEYVVERELTGRPGKYFGMPLWEIRLLHRGQLVRAFPNEVQFESHNNFGLVPVLAPDIEELVIAQYSGGAHCCTYYWIYELGPEPTLLYE